MSRSLVATGVVRLLRLAGVIGMLAGGCGWFAGSAWATPGHAFVGQFGGFVDPEVGPAGLDVTSSGDVVALNHTNGIPPQVQRFDGAGAVQPGSFEIAAGFGLASALALDAGGEVYVAAYANPLEVLKYDASGTLLHRLDVTGSGTSFVQDGSGFPVNRGLAVDPVDGTVYVPATTDDGKPVIDRFDGSTGAFLDFFDGSNGSSDGLGFACPNGLAVDGAHRVYVLDSCKGRVDQYSSGGVFGATVDDVSSGRGAPVAVATDPVSGDIYVAQQSDTVGVQVTQFSPGGGSVLYTFGASNVGGVRAMAVGGDGMVYLSDASSPLVKRFASFAGPTVTTDAATDIAARSVTLNGSINPEVTASSYHFEYGPDQTYGSRTPDVDVGGGGAPVAATAHIMGLSPNLEYHYRIVGSNDSGSITGPDLTFTTARASATLDPSLPFVSAITPRSARLFASINPNRNQSVSWHIEYGTTTAYGATADAVRVPGGQFSCGAFSGACGGDAVTVVAAVSGLAPGTLYHFRLLSFDDFGGDQQGIDQTFITAPAAAAGAVGVTAKSATLRGTIDAHGVATTYHFNYGLTTAYGSSTPEVDGGHGGGEGLVTQAISGLRPSTTYHVQVVATSGDVVRSGGDGLFTTSPAPISTATFPTGVSTSAATLTGTATTFGAAGSYRFELAALDGSYSVVTDDRALAAVADPQPVSVAVAGLPAGKTFRVQLAVTGNGATGYSDLITFATAPNPPVAPPMPETDPTVVFGCTAPHIDTYNKRPAAGEVITITGRDLGLSGTVALGDETFTPSDWTESSFKVRVPDDAKGTLGLTASCGRVSNTIAVAVFHEPDNRFSVPRRLVSGRVARLVVRVPGPGKVETTGTRITASKVTIKKAGGEVTVTARLNRAGTRALDKAKTHRLRVGVGVRFTPAGGKPASKSLTVTFQGKAGR